MDVGKVSSKAGLGINILFCQQLEGISENFNVAIFCSEAALLSPRRLDVQAEEKTRDVSVVVLWQHLSLVIC